MGNPVQRKLKVIQVITRLDQGGAPEIFLSLAANSDKSRYETIIVNGLTKNPALGVGKLGEQKIRQIVIPCLIRDINIFFDLLAFLRLWFLFRKEKPDIVHLHTSKAGALGRIAARLSGVPLVIYSTHGHVFYGYFGPIMSAFIIAAERILSSFCDVITVLSELEKKELIAKRIAPESKLRVIYNGINLDAFLNPHFDLKNKKEGFNFSAEAPVIGLISRLEPVKNPLSFVEAARLISEHNKEARFLVIGEGVLRKDMEELSSKLKIYDKFFFAGFRRDVPELLQIMDIVVQPSFNEGFGLSIIEAQAAAKPVVATRVGGIPEVLKDGGTGILVPSGDAVALSSAINDLLENKHKAVKMGEAGRNFVESRFSLESVLKEYYNLYDLAYRNKATGVQGKD